MGFSSSRDADDDRGVVGLRRAMLGAWEGIATYLVIWHSLILPYIGRL